MSENNQGISDIMGDLHDLLLTSVIINSDKFLFPVYQIDSLMLEISEMLCKTKLFSILVNHCTTSHSIFI